MIAGVYGERYFLEGETHAGPQTYDRHIEYLKRVVPEDRLHFIDLNDGWGPLCKILGKDVPDVPFPRLNETAALGRILRDKTWLGLRWWAVVLGFLTLSLSVMWKAL